jgi:hypothetical protein
MRTRAFAIFSVIYGLAIVYYRFIYWLDAFQFGGYRVNRVSGDLHRRIAFLKPSRRSEDWSETEPQKKQSCPIRSSYCAIADVPSLDRSADKTTDHYPAIASTYRRIEKKPHHLQLASLFL